MIDRYQQHEIPQLGVRIIQYDQHQVQCGCGTVHTATRPEGAREHPEQGDSVLVLSGSTGWYSLVFVLMPGEPQLCPPA